MSHAIEHAAVGSIFERTPHGWNVKWVDGGTVQYIQGATIDAALKAQGVVFPEPSAVSVVVPPPNVEPLVEERRAPIDEQPIALADAEEAGTLPEEDRRAGE